MKKLSYTLVGIIALAAVAAAVWFGLMRTSDPFAAATEDETIEVEQPEEVRDVIQVTEPDPAESEMIDEPPMPAFGNDFIDLELTLAGELPSTKAEAPVFEMQRNQRLSTDEMITLARQFGFDGQLYSEARGEDQLRMEAEMVENMSEEEAAEFVPPQSYFMFDGTRRLSFYDHNINYQDMSGDFWRGGPPPNADDMFPYDEALQIAEAFMLERDLLPDVYVAKEGWGGGVQFLEVIDGAVFNRPIATVQFDTEGVIRSIDYTSLIALEENGIHAVTSANVAWDKLVENPGLFEFNFMPSAEFMFGGGDMPQPKNWQRELADDAEVTRTTWLQVMTPLDGGEAVIWAEDMQVAGSAEIIADLADLVGRNAELTGTIAEVDGVKIFNVTSFNEVTQPNDVYLSGTIAKDADGTKLVVSGGLTMLLPDAPDDVEDGMQVNVYGYSISNNESGFPVFNWRNMDEQVDYRMYEEQMSDGHDPFSTDELTITDVTLVYQWFYPQQTQMGGMGGRYMEPQEMFVPTWQFSGETDSGATLEFWVPAIDTDQLAGN